MGSLAARVVPARVARVVMLVIAWSGAVVVLARGLLALWG